MPRPFSRKALAHFWRGGLRLLLCAPAQAGHSLPDSTSVIGRNEPGAFYPLRCALEAGARELSHPAAQSAIPSTVSHYACIDLVNSRFADHLGSGKVYDRLARAEWQAWFLSRWHLEVEDPNAPVPLPALQQARALVREVLERWGDGQAPQSAELRAINALLALAPAVRQLDPGIGRPLRLVPLRRDWNWAIAGVMASLGELLAEGDPRRLKVCGNPPCTFMFYDDSQNRSRRWCDGGVCGNLIKVRQYRLRSRRTD